MKQETKRLLARFWLGIVLGALCVGATHLPAAAWIALGGLVLMVGAASLTFYCLLIAFPTKPYFPTPPNKPRPPGEGPPWR